ncbi:MAG: HAD hydrolase-like protein, partial [Bilophila sp.]
VFDCDGVILESVDAKTEAFAQVAEPYGEEARDRLVLFHRLHGGVSRREKFDWLFREVLGRQITPEEMETLCARFVTFALDNVLNAPLVPGILDVLDRWKGRVPLYVCSGTPQAELVTILTQRKLAPYFTGISGTPPAKAEQLKAIVRKEGVDPADAVMVGDASTDRLAAEAAGTRFYGRGAAFTASGYPWGEDLTALNAWLEEVGK